MDGFLKIDAAPPGRAEEGAPRPERVIDGNPVNRTWEIEVTPDKAVSTGIWEVEPGAWRVVKNDWELCIILQGVSELSQEGTPPVRVTAGDSFIMRPGFTCTWRVIETTRKLYVISEQKPPLS